MTLQRTFFCLGQRILDGTDHGSNKVGNTPIGRCSIKMRDHSQRMGWLTAPQWSPIDADLDGDEDLFAFDRHGLRLFMFERTEETNAEGNLVMRWDWSKAGQKWLIGACCAITIATANPTFSPASKTASASSPTPRPSEGPSFDPFACGLEREFRFWFWSKRLACHLFGHGFARHFGP